MQSLRLRMDDVPQSSLRYEIQSAGLRGVNSEVCSLRALNCRVKLTYSFSFQLLNDMLHRQTGGRDSTDVRSFLNDLWLYLSVSLWISALQTVKCEWKHVHFLLCREKAVSLGTVSVKQIVSHSGSVGNRQCT